MVGKTALTYITILLLTATFANAFGISYQYMENNTLFLYPGQNYLFKLTIQNKDPEDLIASVILNSTVANLVGKNEVYVPGQTYDTFVYFNITIPRDAEIGQDFAINYAVTPIEKGEGQVPLSVRYTRAITIKVIERDPNIPDPTLPTEMPVDRRPFYKTTTFIILAGALLAIIFFLVILLIWNKSRQISSNIRLEEYKEPSNKKSVQEPEATLTSYEPAKPKKIQKEEPKTSPVVKEDEPIKKQRRALHAFNLHKGGTIRTLEELASSLKQMDDEVFYHHVSRQRNDFATWVQHSFKEPELAEELAQAKTKEEMARLVKDAL